MSAATGLANCLANASASCSWAATTPTRPNRHPDRTRSRRQLARILACSTDLGSLSGEKGAEATHRPGLRGHDVEPERVVVEQSEELVDGLLAAVDLDVACLDGLV